MIDLNNMSEAYRLYVGGCDKAAYAIALGKEAIVDRAVGFAALIESDPTLEALDLSALARDVYVEHIRIPAETIADKAGRPLSPQTDKSRTAQVSKFAAYGKLGFRARDNDAVLPVLRDAVKACDGAYTATTKVVVELVKALAKDPQASEETLTDVVARNLPQEKVVTPQAFVERMVKSLAKAKDGTDSEAGILAACLDADPAKRAAYDSALQSLTDLAAYLARDADPLAA